VGFRHVVLEEDKREDRGQEQTSKHWSGEYTCRISSILIFSCKQSERTCGVVTGYLALSVTDTPIAPGRRDQEEHWS
jgi:hypothetical protein